MVMLLEQGGLLEAALARGDRRAFVILGGAGSLVAHVLGRAGSLGHLAGIDPGGRSLPGP
jgi:hypothetical protein